MTVATFKAISELLLEKLMVPETVKVNLTVWRDLPYVTISFMFEGMFYKYNVSPDGTMATVEGYEHA
jgi:hypothetical protein